MRKSLFPPFLLAAATLALSACATQPKASPGTATRSADAPAPQSSATLDVRFAGIEIPAGQIMLILFDSEAAFDKDGEPVRAAAVEITGGTAVARFAGLAPGTYAVKAFHDVDSDGELGMNPFGLPLEPFAFSNNAKAEGGPPRWEGARFTVAPGANSISITIR